MFKKIVSFKLKFIAKLILWKHKPKIIGITGSVGKTTTKDAIAKVLENNFRIYAAKKSMNFDTGIPLTIMREEIPANIRNPFLWFKALWEGAKQIFEKNYPKVLILEYGPEGPGDLDYLLSIAKPNISVITSIAESHMHYFKTIEKVLEEKEKLVTKAPNARAILNTDFVQLKNLAKRIENEKLTYGLDCFISDPENCVTASRFENTLAGLKFALNFRSKSYNLKTKLFGKHMSYPLLAAFAVGILMEMEPKEIISKLKSVMSTPGRMNLLKGINGSTIIDDSYNSSPQAALKAIESVEKFKGEKRLVLVLGSMNELGDFSEEAHRKVGVKAGEIADILITVGEMAEKWLAWSARGRGLTKVYSFKDPFSAGEFLKRKVQKNDLVLIKGSQDKIYTEEITKVLMGKRYDPKEVLVRQTADWIRKKKIFAKTDARTRTQN